MDAPEDHDVKLQRASQNLLAEFEISLQRYLWSTRAKTTTTLPNANPDLVARKFVSQKKTDSLVNLLEPFQEWPQLLDPRLKDLLQPLVSAFLAYLCNSQTQYFLPKRSTDYEIIPLPRGISRILYTFCKIRGEKIVSQFLDNSPRYLDLMLHCFQEWSQIPLSLSDAMNSSCETATWEERYIILLWLSHIMLSPFDLDSISSVTSENVSSESWSVDLPQETPPVARQIVFISVKYLGSAGREREAARALLVRLVLRPDMYKLGLLHSLFKWSMSSMNVSKDGLHKPIYFYLGTLSFLNGVLRSSSKAAIAPFLKSVFQLAQFKIMQGSAEDKALFSSSMARKLIIKILRSVTLQALQPHVLPQLADPSSISEGVLEDTVDHLLTFLSDKDTSVRLASSKALSMIASKLDVSTAVQIVEAVIASFDENVIWDADSKPTSEKFNACGTRFNSHKLNLAAIDPLRWHGLVMTLSYLIYHRSTTREQVPKILGTLIVALGFEQRSSVGSSLGTSVRDAACFGIWALARRYSTAELLSVDVSVFHGAKNEPLSFSILQALCNHTLLAAILDSSGNIRRGASAALQEMIGRHPDIIIEGIALVQTVDYNAVSLRSRAILDVALAVSKLDSLYRSTVLDGLLSWRGIGSPDANSRRWAATAIGLLATSNNRSDFDVTVLEVLANLRSIHPHQVEERHGLLLSLAAMVTRINSRLIDTDNCKSLFEVNLGNVWGAFDFACSLLEREFSSSISRPELTVEALCTLLSALSLTTASNHLIASGDALTSPENQNICIKFLSRSLSRKEENVVEASSKAAQDFFKILDRDQRNNLMLEWVSLIKNRDSSRFPGSGGSVGHIATLGAIFQYFAQDPILSQPGHMVIDTIISQIKPHNDMDIRVAAMQSLAQGVLGHETITSPIIEALEICLDDYTTDQRGDIGSLIRVQGIDAVSVALQHNLIMDREVKRSLLAKVCRLAAEKLDKVRFRAWTCIQKNLGVFADGIPLTTQIGESDSVSSKEYYQQILVMWPPKWLGVSITEGCLSSAGGGSESAIRSSRVALVDFIEKLSASDLKRLIDEIITIMRTQISNDRVIVPALSVVSFLFDVAALDRLDGDSSCWRNLFAQVQHSQYKSRNPQKLEFIIHAYTGMASVKSIRDDAISKLCSMLLHPFSMVRISAAESLFQISHLPELRRLSLSGAPKDMKAAVLNIRQRLELKPRR